MYALIRSGGRQYKVEPGEIIRLGKIDAEKGAAVELGPVLAVSDGDDLKMGTPTLPSASVKARVIAHGRGRKLVVFKFKRRKGHHCKNGHRQDYTEVKIEEIATA